MHCFVNLYGCRVGDDTRIGSFVEVQKNAAIGARCKIQSHTFVCEGVTIEDEVFVGHGVVFINDPDPRATAGGRPMTDADWRVVPDAGLPGRLDRQRRGDPLRRDDRPRRPGRGGGGRDPGRGPGRGGGGRAGPVAPDA